MHYEGLVGLCGEIYYVEKLRYGKMFLRHNQNLASRTRTENLYDFNVEEIDFPKANDITQHLMVHNLELYILWIY